MIGPRVAVFGLIVAVALPVHAQNTTARTLKFTVAAPKPSRPPTSDSLANISRRGRDLLAYDSVAKLAADAIPAPSSAQTVVKTLISRHIASGWEVAAGELSADQTGFLISHLATPGIQRNRWASSTFDPPQPDTGYFARAGRAIAASVTMFHRVADRPYIATAVPVDGGPGWWVYLYPAPTADGLWPRGGDVRFRVSADGRVITETRHLHESITQYSARSARSSSAPAVDRTPLVSGDTPEDTDVFHVLQRRPALPELMSAGRFQYRIDVDGTIRLLGSR